MILALLVRPAAVSAWATVWPRRVAVGLISVRASPAARPAGWRRARQAEDRANMPPDPFRGHFLS
jgi:hypothetical protein